MDELISIVVPVYNTEKFLRECIQSVLTQTYTNWELLLIDDGSVDSSGAICDEYATRDMRIRAFHKENGGVSSARNLGIDNAKGKWIIFLDSDNWFESSALEVLYWEVQMRRNVDICLGVFRTIDIQNHKSAVIKRVVKADIINSLLTTFTPSTASLIRTSILIEYNIRFPIGVKYCEDLHFMGRLLFYCQSVISVDSIVYNYRMQSESVIHNLNSSTMRDEQWVCGELINFYKAKNVYSIYSRTMNHRLLKACCEHLLHPNQHKKFIDLCRDIPFSDIVTNKFINKKNRIMAFLLLNHCGSVVVVLNYIRKFLNR